MPGLSLAVIIIAVWFLTRMNHAARRAQARRQAPDPAPAPSPVPAAGEPQKAPAAPETAPFREGVFREGAPGSLVFREEEEEAPAASVLQEEHAPSADEWVRAVVMSEVLKRPAERRRTPYGR